MELYHALNRGVDGRDLFLDDHDRVRFVHNLYEFNDTAPASNVGYRFRNMGLRDPYIQPRDRLVDLHGWVLMKNHYHLLLSERKESGLSLFLRKLNTGYANYFNERNDRKGTLFQGRTKKILIERDAHFLYILHYLHLNPLDYLEEAAKWRIRSKSGILKIPEALNHLAAYRWSSYLDYVGTKNFPSLITTSLFSGALGNYGDSLTDYLRNAAYDGVAELNLE